jgi:tetratricopeptide (TPR) repeat protein
LAPHYQDLLPSPALQLSAPSTAVHDEILERTFSAFRSYALYLRHEEIQQSKVAAFFKGGGGWADFVSQSKIPVRGLGVLKGLLDQSWSVRHENPEEMVSLARLAVDIAGRLNRRWHSEQDAADWQARSWSELANALRTRDDLDQAERDFGVAFDFFFQGTGDLSLKARLYDLHASYLGTRRQFNLAFTALDIAYATYIELSNNHLAGRSLLTKAIYTFYNDEPEKALALNRASMALIDTNIDPDLSFFAFHNELLFLVDLGRCPEAKRAFFLYQKDFHKFDGHINRLKVRWLQARISLGLSEFKTAEEALEEVRNGFEKAGLGFHASLASLELALAWMRQGRHEAAEEMVLNVADVFVVLRIQREALGTIAILKGAFERQMGTIELLEDVVAFLRRLYVNPNEKFMPRGE